MQRADVTLVLLEIETIYGTDPIPTKSANAFIATNVKPEPVFKTIPRLGMHQSGGKFADLVIGEAVKINFDTELYAAPSANAVPYVDPILQACGFKKTGGTSTPVVYTHSMNNWNTPKSVTIYVYEDQTLYKIPGCVGNLKITAVAGELVKLSCEFTGLYASPVSDTTPLDATFPTSDPIKLVSATLLYDSITFTGTTVNIDTGNTIASRKSWEAASGIDSYYISAIEPSINFDPETVAPDSLDYWTQITSSNAGAFSLTLEAGARDIVITSENAVMTNANDGARDNIKTKDITIVPKVAHNDSTFAPLVLTFS